MKQKTRKIYLSFISLLLAFLTLFLSFGIPKTNVYAKTTNDFESINVLTDLLSADEEFTTKYPYNPESARKIQIIQIVEFGYSNDENLRQDFGLYVYLYNPTKMQVVKNSNNNQIELGVAYNSTPITQNSKVVSYEKFALKYCSSSAGEYEDLYYKFKIVDKVGADGKTIEQRVNEDIRRYDVAGIEILENGKTNAEDYGVGGTYLFSGFAKGLNANNLSAESTLGCSINNLETINLDVQHTYYRTETSSKGVGYQNQIDTVFFSVPNDYFEKYGNLQKIKAQWYEFLTDDIVVIENERAYQLLTDQITNFTDSFFGISQSMIALSDEISAFVDPNSNPGTITYGYNVYNWKYIHDGSISNIYDIDEVDTQSELQYLFKTENISSYDPNANNIENGGIAGSDLADWIYTKGAELLEEIIWWENNGDESDATSQYLAYLDSCWLDIGQGLDKRLFETDIQEERKVSNQYGTIQYGGNGASVYEFDVDIDKQSWETWADVEHSFWENSASWGFWNTLFGNLPSDSGMTVDPIYIIQPNDVKGSNSAIAENLVVNYNDVDYLKDFYANATANNEKVVLFRFAVSDYFSSFIDSVEPLTAKATNEVVEDVGYRAKETIFLDFDVISLTFNDKGTYYTIPVVADPINIVNDITPPYELPEIDFLKIILALLLLILLLFLLWPFLPTIFSFLFWLVKLVFKILWFIIKLVFKILCLPFKFIGWIFSDKGKEK